MAQSSSDSTSEIAARLAPVISAAAERIHYAESRRANYSVMAGALIAAGITIFTFAFGTINVEWIRYGAGFGSLGMICVGSVVLYVFGKQTNRYPFTSATKTWKWFYRDALPDQKAFDPKRWQTWTSQKAAVQKAYADQLPVFSKRMRELADAQTNLDQDIQQAYVLHINEKYKNLYLSRLRSLFNTGLIVIAILTVGGVLFGLWYGSHVHRVITSDISNNAWAQRVEYRISSSALSDTAELSIKVTIDNKADRVITIENIVAKDQRGWILPVIVTYSSTEGRFLASHQTGTLFATMKTDRAISEEIASISADIR